MKMLFLLAASLSVSASGFAASFSEKCPDISTCAKVVSEMTGQKYFYDNEVKGRANATSNLELTTENAELLFTALLNAEGYARVPLGQANTYQIMRQRDARDSAIPSITATQQAAPELPNTWDLYTMKYKATHPEVVEQIARSSRSFMPANSRIIPEESSGLLLVTDTAMNLKKLYSIIRDMDIKPSPEMMKRMTMREKAREDERRMARQRPQEMPESPLPPPGALPAKPQTEKN